MLNTCITVKAYVLGGIRGGPVRRENMGPQPISEVSTTDGRPSISSDTNKTPNISSLQQTFTSLDI